ncbi:MAG: IPT/TIG domain-containing protein [Labilithrix sp.]|nr:IPT/TIG domain-containing protein [Labilithrix sp.]
MRTSILRNTAFALSLTACLDAVPSAPRGSLDTQASAPPASGPAAADPDLPGAACPAAALRTDLAPTRIHDRAPRDPALAISSMEPASGAGGTRVRVRGAGFGALSPGDAVFFRGNAATVESWKDDEIVVRVPLVTSGGTQPVHVVKGAARGPDARFDVKPRVGEIAPAAIRAGQIISIAGTNFGSNQAKSIVRIGGVAAETLVWGMTQIVVRVPELADGDHPLEICIGGQCNDPAHVAVSESASSAPMPTFVTLGFDDTLDSQFQAGEMLSRRGMCGTFYVNSTRIDRRGFMTRAELRSLAEAGHEIGGHTLNHLHLTIVDIDEQRRQICDDRARLVELGFEARSLAYPGGRVSEEARQIAIDCGYTSARLVNGGAEVLPPVDLHMLRVTAAIKSTSTLADLQSWVTRQEAKGGWVNLVFHPICRDCGSNSMDPAVLDAFIDWLDARRSRGTVVRTVHAMIGGHLRATVKGPPPPPPPAGGNMLRNGSFELDANGDGAPDCWVRGTPGGTSHWERASDAVDGAWSERMMGAPGSSYTDRRLNTVQDMGSCAPAIAPGRRYRASVRFKSASRVAINAYYRDDGGFWQSWTSSPTFAPAESFTEAAWTLPPAPEDAAAIGIGIVVSEAKEAFVDDFRLEEVQ